MQGWLAALCVALLTILLLSLLTHVRHNADIHTKLKTHGRGQASLHATGVSSLVAAQISGLLGKPVLLQSCGVFIQCDASTNFMASLVLASSQATPFFLQTDQTLIDSTGRVLAWSNQLLTPSTPSGGLLLCPKSALSMGTPSSTQTASTSPPSAFQACIFQTLVGPAMLGVLSVQGSGQTVILSAPPQVSVPATSPATGSVGGDTISQLSTSNVSLILSSPSSEIPSRLQNTPYTETFQLVSTSATLSVSGNWMFNSSAPLQYIGGRTNGGGSGGLNMPNNTFIQIFDQVGPLIKFLPTEVLLGLGGYLCIPGAQYIVFLEGTLMMVSLTGVILWHSGTQVQISAAETAVLRLSENSAPANTSLVEIVSLPSGQVIWQSQNTGTTGSYANTSVTQECVWNWPVTLLTPNPLSTVKV